MLWQDGTAVIAVALISIPKSAVSYAAWGKAVLLGRRIVGAPTPGYLVIRTKEGAFLLVKCTDAVARDLYSGMNECRYVLTGLKHRLLMTLGGAFLVTAVILLGDWSFIRQLFIGAAFMFLNVACWIVGLLLPSAS